MAGAGVRRARFVVAYDGAPFRGFAPNHDVRTVMGDFSAAIAKVVRTEVVLTGAGRTDAGVHAWGQVISGDLPAETDLVGLMRRVNKLCAPSIAIRSAEWVVDTFDARFSATWRRYRYHVWNDPAPNPLVLGTTWHVPRPLDLGAMNAGVAELVGEHDFSSFCRRPKVRDGESRPSMIRILHDVAWTRRNGAHLLRFEVTGSAFCHQMVRSLVGTTVDMGLGKLEPAQMTAMLAARDRSAAGQVAPPAGLVLWAVGYDGSRRGDA
jgi:tRNA pseudouridine38-40 synthase